MKRVLKGALASVIAMTLTVSGAFSAVTVNATEPETAVPESSAAVDAEEITETDLNNEETVELVSQSDEATESEDIITSEDSSFEDEEETVGEEEITEELVEDASESEAASSVDKIENLTVTYTSEEDGVTGLPVDENTYEKGDLVTVSYEIPSLDGYSFMGWSPAGDGSVIYTGGYDFTIEEDVTLTAIWMTGEESSYTYEEGVEDAENLLGISAKEQQVINAVDNYVNSLDGGRLPKVYSLNGVNYSWTCCAVCDFIWEGVYGHSRRQKSSMCTRIDSQTKLATSEIAQFLDANGATAGDIIWFHDPYHTDNYSITHYLILLSYDENSITFTDGHGVNDHNEIWCNHSTVNWNDSKKNHYKYFNGNCFVSLYHVKDDEVVVGNTSGPVGPTPTPDPTPGEYSGKCGDNLTWTMKSTENYPTRYKLTISGTGPMYDYRYSVNSEYDVPWVAQLDSLPGYSNEFESVTFEEGITRIGNYAFQFFKPRNNSLTLPNSLKEIGEHAFSSSEIRSQLILPPNVSVIGESAFSYSKFTGALDLSHVKELSEHAFSNTKFSSVTFGAGLTEIPDYCFSSCENLGGTIALPEGLTRIGERAFFFYEKNNKNRRLVLPSTIVEIGSDAFCSNNLTEITPMFPESLRKIGDSAFEDCENLTGEITFPEEIAVKSYAFRNCKSLTGHLTIPGTFWAGTRSVHYHLDGSVTEGKHREVADFCFAGCSGLTGLTLGDGLDEIEKCAFYGCSGLSGNLTLPSTGRIGMEAFKDCSSLTSLTFQKRPAKDGNETVDHLNLKSGVFEGCSGLTGTLTLYEDDVLIGDGARLFYGTNYSEIHLEGKWSYQLDSDKTYLYGKNRIGTYTSRADSENSWEDTVYEDYPLLSFPEDAVIYYDDASYLRLNQNNALEKMRTTLDEFGYEYHFYSESGLASPQNHIVDAMAHNVIVAMDSKSTHVLTPYYPYYADPEEMSRITITVDDTSVAEIVPYEHGSGRDFKYVPKKVGYTTYKVTIDTFANGIQVANGSIRVVQTEDDAKKIVTGVDLDYSEKELQKGESFTLKATVRPSTAGNKSVTWNSSNESVATVSSTGLVKAVGKGEAVISVTTAEGGFTDTCLVTVSADSYTVFFDGNGADNPGAMASMDCDYNKKYTLPQNTFTKAGYVFDSWITAPPSDEENFGTVLANKASFTNLVEKPKDADPDADYSITLYARWRTEKSYTIVFDGNAKKAFGATVLGAMSDITGLAYDDSFYAPSCLFTTDGCTFTGWNTKPDGTGREITADQIRSGEALSLSRDLGVTELAKAGIGKTTLYAQWEADQFTAAFDLNDDGTGTAKFASKTFGTKELGSDPGVNANEAIFTFGTAVTKLPTAEREGYAFGGWTTTPDGKTILKSIPKTQAGDLTVYAKWTPWTYTVKYDANKTQGGAKFTVSGKTANTTAIYGEPLSVSENKFINKGYRLVGWTTTKDASAPDEGFAVSDFSEDGTLPWETIASSPALKPDKNKDTATLYAVWQLSDYTLDYELNGGEKNESAENVYASAYTFGTGLLTALPVPVRENYEFDGWYSDPDFKKAVKKIDAKSFGDMVLHAKWKAQYSVMLHDVPEAAGGPRVYAGYTFNKAKALPANPFTRADKAFMGWALTPELAASRVVAYQNKEKLLSPVLSNDGSGMTLNLYGVWRDSFTITADFDGGSYVTGEKNIIPYSYTYKSVASKAITLPSKLEKTGYKFGGWFDRDTNKKVTKITKTTCKDYDIYAKWTALTYQISYKANQPKGCKVTGKMGTQKMTVGTEDDNPLLTNSFHVNGYVFSGWSTKPDGTGDRYDDKAVFSFGGAGYQKKVTLYAVWAKEQ